MPISKHSTLPEMKDYIRKNKLKIKLTQKKADILAELDKGGHIHRGQKTGTITSKNMPKTTPSQVKIDASKKPSLNTKKIEPKKPKFKWTWKLIPSLIFGMIKFMGLFLGYSYLLQKVNISLGVGIFLSISLSWVVNNILRRFNLNNSGMGDILLIPLKKKGDKK